MSLTSLLNEKDVRERFRQEFKIPKFSEKRELLASPLTKHYSLVGTAFDYLMRFYLKRLNPQAVEKRWVAESAVWVMFSKYEDAVCVDLDSNKMWVEPDAIPDKADAALARKVSRVLLEAKNNYQLYVEKGDIAESLLRSVMLLANLDVVYRTGRLDYAEFDVVNDGDLDDLRKLVGIINASEFKVNEICLLNPGFGEASRLVGGADADLLIDDALIDIKTTKDLKFQRGYFNQLIGYYTLNRIGGMGSDGARREIGKLGIYYSRFGYLHLLKVKEHIDEQRFENFLKWFKERAAVKT